ncbi:MAG: AIM24 family protein, partial [Planctomycetes bacterium]|nr:AIM24 family protein [Planctomycetota bacterium]
MEYRISGEIAQTATFEMDAGETLWASKGAIVTYSRGIDWDLKIPGGLGGAIKRSLAGEGIALTYVQSRQDKQRIVLSANAPGHIAVWDLQVGGPVLATRGAFLAAWGSNLDITATVARRAGAAIFGGAGLFLQKVSGVGKVLVHGSGDFLDHDLAADEEILVSTGNLAAFSEQVDYNIRGVGGLKKIVFGREGIFLTKLTGPGKVMLQSLKRGLATAARHAGS